jgi:hypothetical protein
LSHDYVLPTEPDQKPVLTKHIGISDPTQQGELRYKHRSAGSRRSHGSRIKGRGESIALIAALATSSESEARSDFRAAPAGRMPIAAPDALGGVSATEEHSGD